MRPSPLPIVASLLALLPAAVANAQVVEGSVSAGVAAPTGQVVIQQPVLNPQPPTYYVQPQPVYQPQPIYQPVMVPTYRRRVEPFAGGTVPPGAHLEERANAGLLIAGGTVFGVAYLPSLLVGVICVGQCGNHGLGWLMLPVLGPFITLAYPQDEDGVRWLIFDAILQGGGFGLMVAGAVLRNRYIVYDNYAQRSRHGIAEWSFLPGAAGAPAGLSFGFTNF